MPIPMATVATTSPSKNSPSSDQSAETQSHTFLAPYIAAIAALSLMFLFALARILIAVIRK
jgi:hypothetical protein